MPLLKVKSNLKKKEKFKCRNCGKNMLSPGLRILGFLFYPLLAIFFIADSELSFVAIALIIALSIVMSFVKRPKECPHCGQLDIEGDSKVDSVVKNRDTDEFDDEDSMNPGLRSIILFIVIAIVFMSIGTGFVYWFINLL